ncbi:MAG: hypothetical protein N3D10_01955 [Candidatus Micrarchaeota archaeon]|nr:hypothetical protein [Candidatus Micrarchaeota archaeon]
MDFNFNSKQLSYFAVLISLVGAFGVYATSGGILVLFAALLCGLGGAGAVLFYKYGYLLIPLFTKRSNIVQIIAGGYEIPPSQDVILKKEGNTYYASAFLGIKLYDSTTEKSPQENVIYSEYFERAISSVRFPVKFSMMVYVIDISHHRRELETKYAEAQLKLSREREKPEPDILKLDRYEKEVAMYEAQINRLVSGYKPMGTIIYAMTTATGLSKEAAIAEVKSQANELKATLANALNVQVVHLQADEMLKCFEWEHIIPPTASAMESAAY